MKMKDLKIIKYIKPYIISEIKNNLTLNEIIVFNTNNKKKNYLNFIK